MFHIVTLPRGDVQEHRDKNAPTLSFFLPRNEHFIFLN